jgi:hypothetical protein
MQSGRAPNATLQSYGQMETSSGVWIWLALQIATKDLPNALPGARIFDTARMWMFTTFIDGQFIPVSCLMIVPTDATPEHRQAQLEQTTAEFGGITRRLSIGHR